MSLNDDYNYSRADLDNHANQMNPNNDAYWSSRGYDSSDDVSEDIYIPDITDWTEPDYGQ
jgi:hypothetical protein